MINTCWRNLLEDSSFVVFELLSNCNTTWNWTSCIDFCFHFINTRYRTILRYSPIRIICNCPTFTGIYFCIPWNWINAVHASLNIRARLSNWILGLVILTRFLRDTLLLSELIDRHWLATIAASSSITVDNSLNT